MSQRSKIRQTFERGEGILRLIPTWVPRFLGQPGGRLRLHPEDYYALGMKRGPIKERWFSSIVHADNGELAAPDEGMSYVSASDAPEDRFLLREAVEDLGADLIGDRLMTDYGTWPMYSKFFDYETPIFHHLHPDDEAAKRVGRLGKPEGYYYPYQLNNHPGQFPVTYFGFDPDVTIEQVRERLLDFEKRDNRITELSRAYRIELGTGWYTPPGVVHAPGTYLTYEPQWHSDINSAYENVVGGEIFPYEFMAGPCPDDKKRDVDYILSLMDWEANIDPHYKEKYFRPPLPCGPAAGEYTETWVVYANDYIGAKELTVMPGATVTVTDGAAYGCILIQGHGTFGVFDAESSGMLRFGQLSADEYFVSERAARNGVTIVNRSRCEPMVVLKHFGPNHPDMPKTVHRSRETLTRPNRCRRHGDA